MCNYYAIDSVNEAKEYLQDGILKQRLIEISEALLQLETNDAHYIFKSPDDSKVQSCMTLFLLAAPNEIVFQKVLDKYYNGEKNKETLVLLEKQNMQQEQEENQSIGSLQSNLPISIPLSCVFFFCAFLFFSCSQCNKIVFAQIYIIFIKFSEPKFHCCRFFTQKKLIKIYIYYEKHEKTIMWLVVKYGEIEKINNSKKVNTRLVFAYFIVCCIFSTGIYLQIISIRCFFVDSFQ